MARRKPPRCADCQEVFIPLSLRRNAQGRLLCPECWQRRDCAVVGHRWNRADVPGEYLCGECGLSRLDWRMKYETQETHPG